MGHVVGCFLFRGIHRARRAPLSATATFRALLRYWLFEVSLRIGDAPLSLSTIGTRLPAELNPHA